MTWSIFNPHGPTINCVGLLDKRPGIQDVFYRWLHFLQDETFWLGQVDTSVPDRKEQLAHILEAAFRLEAEIGGANFNMVTCVPSLVTCSRDAEGLTPLLAAEDAQRLLGLSQGIQNADWGAEMHRLRKYGSRLFDRAGEEYRAALEKLRREGQLSGETGELFERFMRARLADVTSFRDDAVVKYESKGFDPLVFAEWWETVTDPSFTAAGLMQVAQAWVGAIHGTGESMGAVVRFEDVQEFLDRFRHALWPGSLTSGSLLKSLGLA
jgi:hypothetical protein